MTLHFTATGALPTTKHTRILPMTQLADNIWNEGKFLLLFTNHRRCWKCCPSTHKYLSKLNVLLHIQQSLHLQHTRHQLSLDGFSNCVAVLVLDFDTAVSWAKHFSDFLGICSRLAPMSSNVSSVSTQWLCFFLFIRSPIVLSLFTRVWIVCLLRTLSTQNFHWHFPADPYFT
jgi:hypothetical protein